MYATFRQPPLKRRKMERSTNNSKEIFSFISSTSVSYETIEYISYKITLEYSKHLKPSSPLISPIPNALILIPDKIAQHMKPRLHKNPPSCDPETFCIQQNIDFSLNRRPSTLFLLCIPRGRTCSPVQTFGIFQLALETLSSDNQFCNRCNWLSMRVPRSCLWSCSTHLSCTTSSVWITSAESRRA